MYWPGGSYARAIPARSSIQKQKKKKKDMYNYVNI